jgi:hypothetical protein
VHDGYVPPQFRCCRITPIFKSGDQKDPRNYRPIAVGSVFSLILEKVICSKLTSFLETNNILFPEQFGFRRGRSTAHATLWLSNAIINAVGIGQQVGVAFVDLKDAFPSVDHSILIKKLEHYGIRGGLLKWLSSFVTKRSMYVYLECASEMVVATRGVPQGSALGPVLFLIYYNDIVKAVSSRIILFADDTALMVSSDTCAGLTNQLNAVLKELKRYLDVNKLSLNVKKTECMFPFLDLTSPPLVVYDSSRLSVVRAFKYLGVYFDNLCSWNVHVQHVISKVKSKLFLMYRSRYCCYATGRKLLFTAVVQPHFLYCSETWRSCSRTLSESVEILYRHCLRIVLNDLSFRPKLGNTTVYNMVNLLPLSIDFQLRAACLLFTIIRLNVNLNFVEHFERKVGSHSTRNCDDESCVLVPFTRREYERGAFRFWGSVLWNCIPCEIRNVSTLSEFRYKYKQHLEQRFKAGIDSNRKFYDFI